MLVRNQWFQYKPFISLISLWSFCTLLFSGVVLFIKPSGSIANAIDWKFLGIDKVGWEALHTIVSVTFILFIILHVYFNWRALVMYLSARFQNGISYRKELIISLLLMILITAGGIARVQPFKKLVEFRQYLKYEWRAAP